MSCLHDGNGDLYDDFTFKRTMRSHVLIYFVSFFSVNENVTITSAKWFLQF